jgi:hypothetical protein
MPWHHAAMLGQVILLMDRSPARGLGSKAVSALSIVLGTK